VKPAVSLNPGEHPFLARIEATRNKNMCSVPQGTETKVTGDIKICFSSDKSNIKYQTVAT